MRLIVVAVADVGGSDEELERVVLIQVQCARFDLLLQLPHALLSIAVRGNGNRKIKSSPLLSDRLTGIVLPRRFVNSPAESKVLFVAPENRRSSSDCSFGQHVMQNHHLDHEQNKIIHNDTFIDKACVGTGC